MIKTILFRGWSGTLIQGLLMIVLSVVIFYNPESVLSALAFWLGVSIAIGGLAGIISWIKTSTKERSINSIIGSVVMLLAGLIMIFKLAVTVNAITMVFGLLTSILGLVLLSSGLKNKSNWSLWWIVTLFGVLTLITGVKGFFDSYSGAESISNIIGFAVLFSGLGLVFLAFLKRRLVARIEERLF